MNESHQNTERIRDLLADQALFELSTQEQAELNALLANSTVDPDSFEWTAALAAVALNPGPHESLPAELRAKIAAAAPEHQAAAQLIADSKRVAPVSLSRARNGIRFREALAWFAAAACLFIALTLWFGTHPATRSLADVRDALTRQPGVFTANWTATEDPTAKGASGDVVWSKTDQQGYMRFKGLAKNDPEENQYQLWIFDSKQDERYPIDGGVFNVDSASGEVIVPIHAKLNVEAPKMFAVTVEKPGGVVVSARDRIALLAKND